jgi:hypothetical protein
LKSFETDQFIFEPELLFASYLDPTAFEQLEEHFLIKVPGTVLISIGEGRAIRSRGAQQLRNPPIISRRERARPNWQKSIDINCPQHLKPRAFHSAWVSRTAR